MGLGQGLVQRLENGIVGKEKNCQDGKMNNIKRMVKKSGTSFFWSMRLLPAAQRNAMYTIYAFFRHIDDIVDGEADMDEKLELILSLIHI